jgi:type II secretory pathway component PulJ
VTLAFSVIGLMIALVLVAARLGDAQRQLDQARRESAEQARRAREEQAAYQYGTAAALACLLAGLAAAHWTAPPPRRGARFEAGAGGREDAQAGAAGKGPRR